MKLRQLLCLGLISSLSFVSCTNLDENSEWNDGNQSISFSSIISNAKSRVSNNEWNSNDKVGIFMMPTSGNISQAISSNMLYKSDNSGNLSATDKDNSIYFPTDNSKVDFIAYYPYTATLDNNTFEINVEDQSSQSSIDLIYSNNAKGYSKSSTEKPSLTFSHILSNIIFNINADATIASTENLNVTFKGLNTKATFNLENGTISNISTINEISAKINNATASLIAIPSSELKNVEIVFELDGQTFECSYPQSSIEGGYKYSHNVTLSINNGQPVVRLEGAIIEDWTEVTGDDIDVNFGEDDSNDDNNPSTPSESTILEESFSTSIGDFSIVNKSIGTLSFVWEHTTHEGVGSMKGSAYKNGSVAAESWLVSPIIDLSNATSAILSFNHCHMYSTDDCKKEMTLLAAIDGTENWKEITIPTYGSGNDYNYVSSGDINLNEFAGKSIKIAFKYLSTSASSPKWNVKDITIKANGTSTDKPGTSEPDTDNKPGTDGQPDTDTPSTSEGNLITNAGFESWGTTHPTNWEGTYNTGITKGEDIKHSGNYSAVHISPSKGHSKLQQEVNITAGKTYKISYWLYDNTSKARSRQYSYWLDESNGKIVDSATDNILHSEAADAYSTDNDEWQYKTVTVTAPSNAVKFRFEIRTYPENNNSGEPCYYDDIEIVEVK